MPYKESPEAAIAERKKLMDDVLTLIENQRAEADKSRTEFFRPDMSSPEDYEASLPSYRSALIEKLGWPLTDQAEGTPQGRADLVAEDELGRIYRVHVKACGPVESYGLLFLPREKGNYPLVIAHHGGWHSPELASHINDGDVGHNEIVTGLRDLPVAIFAPQAFVWHNAIEPHFDKGELDRKFRQLGGSRVAMDLLMLTRSLDWLCAHDEIDAERIGMSGLSYGGLYTLFFAAIDARIRVAVSSCWVNDRYKFCLEDWAWPGIANYFFDTEIGRMICPRSLFLELGQNDHLFTTEGFLKVAAEIEVTYRKLVISDRFHSRIHSGGHDYDPDGMARAFLLKSLGIKDSAK